MSWERVLLRQPTIQPHIAPCFTQRRSSYFPLTANNGKQLAVIKRCVILHSSFIPDACDMTLWQVVY